MTSPDERPTLDDVMDTQESAPRDRQEHGGIAPRPNDEALQHRTEQERQAVGSDDAAPGGADEHPPRTEGLPRPARARWDHRDMDDARLRWGALAWLLTLQFFVAETIAQLRYDGPYSRVEDVISDLGAGGSPAASLMNASFVLQGVLIAAGALLLRSALPRPGGGLATVLLAVAGAGVLVVGIVPLDADGRVHAAGAVAYLIGGSTGLLALAHALRPRSEPLGSLLALLGVVATAMSVFFLAGVTRYLGVGGTERAAAYLLPLGLALAGGGLWRLGRAPAGAPPEEAAADGSRRRELRAQERSAAEADDGEEDHWAPSGRQQD